jgi:hypothetical protein
VLLIQLNGASAETRWIISPDSHEDHGPQDRFNVPALQIVDERDLGEATQSLNAHLETQPTTTVVASIRKVVGE